MDNKVRVLIADGNEEFCEHLKRVLEQSAKLEVVGIANDGARAVELLVAKQPDLLVLDLMLAKLDGISVLKKAMGMETRPVALVMTGFMTEYVGNMAA